MPERILPREFEMPPHYIVPLSNLELQELGTFAAIWSQIDWIILMIYCFLAKIESGPALLTMENMTTGPRINLITKLCQADPDHHTKKAIKKLCDDNGGLVEDRNHITHGLWAIEWEYDTNKTVAACLYQKGNRKPIRADKLRTLSDRAAIFCNRLAKLSADLNPPLQRGEAPNRFWFGAGSPVGRTPPPWPPTEPQPFP